MYDAAIIPRPKRGKYITLVAVFGIINITMSSFFPEAKIAGVKR